MNATIEKALEDYDYGFYTTHDADSGDVLVGTCCAVCEDEFIQVKTIETRLSLSNCICDKCVQICRTIINEISILH